MAHGGRRTTWGQRRLAGRLTAAGEQRGGERRLFCGSRWQENNARDKGGLLAYSSGQNKVNVRLACNDRATVIALERNGKKPENGNTFRRTRFLNFVLY